MQWRRLTKPRFMFVYPLIAADGVAELVGRRRRALRT